MSTVLFSTTIPSSSAAAIIATMKTTVNRLSATPKGNISIERKTNRPVILFDIVWIKVNSPYLILEITAVETFKDTFNKSNI